eukprot:TRINITY_DN1266_c0_g2_i5.p1 TRINITY_DN1266_c0_g2~~TRINITY_DN1266_c0_g2_i5.p1  ORF type:complete len:283 (+),score=104.16 TRINITY_DN1266_c0_g2_i5:490-1338(+)
MRNRRSSFDDVCSSDEDEEEEDIFADAPAPPPPHPPSRAANHSDHEDSEEEEEEEDDDVVIDDTAPPPGANKVVHVVHMVPSRQPSSVNVNVRGSDVNCSIFTQPQSTDSIVNQAMSQAMRAVQDRERELEFKLGEAQQRAAMTEQRLFEQAQKFAAEKMTLESYVQQAEEARQAAALHAQQAEARAEALDAELAVARQQLARFQQTFPNWEAVSAHMAKQEQQLIAAREHGRYASEELEKVLSSAGKHLIGLANNAKALKDISDMVTSLDKVLTPESPPSR